MAWLHVLMVPIHAHVRLGRPSVTHLYGPLAVGLLVELKLTLQQEALATLVAHLHAVVRGAHVLLQVPVVVEAAGAAHAREGLPLLQPHLQASLALRLLRSATASAAAAAAAGRPALLGPQTAPQGRRSDKHGCRPGLSLGSVRLEICYGLVTVAMPVLLFAGPSLVVLLFLSLNLLSFLSARIFIIVVFVCIVGISDLVAPIQVLSWLSMSRRPQHRAGILLHAFGHVERLIVQVELHDDLLGVPRNFQSTLRSWFVTFLFQVLYRLAAVGRVFAFQQAILHMQGELGVSTLPPIDLCAGLLLFDICTEGMGAHCRDSDVPAALTPIGPRLHALLGLLVARRAGVGRQGAPTQQLPAGGGDVGHLQHGGGPQHVLHVGAGEQQLGGVDEVQDLLQALGLKRLEGQLHALELLAVAEQRVEEGAVRCQDPFVSLEGGLVAQQHDVHVAQIRLEQTLVIEPVH